jgi:hypothetical protein
MEKTFNDQTGRLYLAVPLDYRAVVQERPHGHAYGHVLKRFMHDWPKVDATIAALQPYAFSAGLEGLPSEKVNETDPYWNNGFFSGGDARAAYGFTGLLKPKRIMEIGSGNSSKFFRKAIRDFGLSTRLTSIDPMPRAEIDVLCDEIIRESVLKVDTSVFASLQPMDILFLDGSHITFNGTDTVHFFLEILPVVPPGVIVHIHDIMLPYEYVPDFDGRGYSEQYMLATALLNDTAGRYSVMLPVHYAAQKKVFPGGTSFWMQV